MPSKLFLVGDTEPLYLNDPPDGVLAVIDRADQAAIAKGSTSEFIRLDTLPYTAEDQPRPAYFRPAAVSAIMPMHPHEVLAMHNDPPEWLEGDD